MRTFIIAATALTLLAGPAFAGDWVVKDLGLSVVVTSEANGTTIKVDDEKQGKKLAAVLNDHDDKKK